MNLNFFYSCFLFLLAFLNGFSQVKKKFTLIIDPGHGGKDPGGYGYYGGYEKNIALAVAKKVGAYLNLSHKNSIKIIYTRNSDVFVSLKQRADAANKNQGDLFVSIHCNASPKDSSKGSETYVLAPRRNQDNLDVIKRENSVISFEDEDQNNNYENFDPDSPESFIGFTMIQSIYLKNSIKFANLVEKNFSLYGRESRGVKQGPFLVVREVSMPSVLIELGFLTNKEGLFLASEKGQSMLAWSIYKALIEFISLYTKDQVEESEALKNYNAIENEKKKFSPEISIPPSKQKSIYYEVQLFSLSRKLSKIELFDLSKKLSNQKINSLKELNSFKCFREDNLYKYTSGSTLDKEEIKEYLSFIKKIVPSAFIIGIKDGKKLSSEELNTVLGK